MSGSTSDCFTDSSGHVSVWRRISGQSGDEREAAQWSFHARPGKPDKIACVNLPLESKTALVTGASKGVGKGIALELARAGAQVMVNYNSDSAGADAAVAEIRGMAAKAFAVQADVSVPAAP